MTIDWTALGRQLRVAADSMAGLGGPTCPVADAYQFLLDNPEAFGAPEDGWPEDMERLPNVELIAAYYGYTKEPMADPLAVAKRMAVDLLADIRKPYQRVTLPNYTVIGIYQDTGQVFCQQFQADDEHAAMAKAANAAESGELDILGAIEGLHTIVCACEDSGKSANVCDLGSSGEEEEGPRCNGDCGEIVQPDSLYYATPCGSFCEDCMERHAAEWRCFRWK